MKKRIFALALFIAALLGIVASKPQTTNAQQAPQTATRMQTGTPTHGAFPFNSGEWYLNGRVGFKLTGQADRTAILHASEFGFNGFELLEKTGISDFPNTFGTRFAAREHEMLEFGGETDCPKDGWDFPLFLEQDGEGFGDHWFFWVRLPDGTKVILAEADSRGREYCFRVWAKHPAVRIYTDARARTAPVLQPAVDALGPFYSFDTVFNGPNERRRTKQPVVIALDMQQWAMGQCATFGFTLKTMGWGGTNGILVSSIVTKTVEQPGDIEKTRNIPGLFDGVTGGYFTGHPCGNCEVPVELVCFDSPAFWLGHPEYYTGKVVIPQYNYWAAVDAKSAEHVIQIVLRLQNGSQWQQLAARYVAAQLALNRQFRGQLVPQSALSAERWLLFALTNQALRFGTSPAAFQQLIAAWDVLLGTDPTAQCYVIAPCPCPGGGCGK